MTSDAIKARIQTLAPNTQVELVDLTGTNDHWQALIVSPAFEGRSLIQQHRMVFDLFKTEVESNDVHALSLKTFTPEQWAQKNHQKN